jgi:histidinol-phosphate aminotransferase
VYFFSERLKEIRMTRSRRDFLHSLGIGAAAGAVVRWPLGISNAYAGEPARTTQSDGFIRLNSNENAYGPSRKVADAVRAATGMVNRYPFMKYDEITECIASFHKVKAEQVLFGCGSTELLRVAACAFLGNGRQLIQAIPTFESIEYFAKSVGSEVTSVPLHRSSAHDLDGMFSHVDASTGLVYICNPNNPTGSLTPRQNIENFIRRVPAATRVLIDEAYHEFVVPTGMYASFIDAPLNDERVIVTRTFSKVYGLAGLRLGYAVASAKVIEKMRPFLTLAGVNAIVAEVVGVALNDTDGIKEAVRRNRNDRQEFLNRANTRNLKPIDPHANFVMINTQHPAEEVIEHFRKHHILIGRKFPLMDTSIRVSLGTPEEMRVFWQTWDLLPWSNKLMHH